MSTIVRNAVSRCGLIVPVMLASVSLVLVSGCCSLFPPPTDGEQTGACCATDGTCSVATQTACESAGGTYQGDGTSCTPNPCSAAEPDGTTLYSNNCATCHGSDGSGPPNITGKTAAELTTGLESASHGGVAELTEAEISAIATFLGG